MIDVDGGGGAPADPVLAFADRILERYGVDSEPRIGAGAAAFAESIAAPHLTPPLLSFNRFIPGLAASGLLGAERWLSYLPTAAFDGYVGVEGYASAGYAQFDRQDPFYLAMEPDGDEGEDLGFWAALRAREAAEAEAAEDPEAWKLWTLFPKAPQRPAPRAVGQLADGPWAEVGATGAPIRTQLDPALPTMLRRSARGEAYAPDPHHRPRQAVAMQRAEAEAATEPAAGIGRPSPAPRARPTPGPSLPALSKSLRALEQRGLLGDRGGRPEEAFATAPTLSGDHELALLERMGSLGASSGRAPTQPWRKGPGAVAPGELEPAVSSPARPAGPRLAGLAGSSPLGDLRLARLGLAGWHEPRSRPPEASDAGVWRQLTALAPSDPELRMAPAGETAPSAPGQPAGVGRRASLGDGLPPAPPALARFLPAGFESLQLAGPRSIPLRLPAAPLSAVEVARLSEATPEIFRWFRFASGHAPEPGAQRPPRAPAVARQWEAAYVVWLDHVRASSAPAGRRPRSLGWPVPSEAPSALETGLDEASWSVLRALLPGASGSLATALERYLPSFLGGLAAGASAPRAAAQAGLSTQVGERLLAALTPGVLRASGFVPRGMVSLSLEDQSSPRRPEFTPDATEAGEEAASVAGAPQLPSSGLLRHAYAPPLSVAVDRAREAGIFTTSMTGLAPADLLDLFAAGPADGGLRGVLLELLTQPGSGIAAMLSGTQRADAVRALLAYDGGASLTLGDLQLAVDAPGSALAELPASTRSVLLRTLLEGASGPAAPALRAALQAAGMPVAPSAAVSALLRGEVPRAALDRFVTGYAKMAGVGAFAAPEPALAPEQLSGSRILGPAIDVQRLIEAVEAAERTIGGSASPQLARLDVSSLLRALGAGDLVRAESVARAAGLSLHALTRALGSLPQTVDTPTKAGERPNVAEFFAALVEGDVREAAKIGRQAGLNVESLLQTLGAQQILTRAQRLESALTGKDQPSLKALRRALELGERSGGAEDFQPVVASRWRPLRPAGGVGAGELPRPEAAVLDEAPETSRQIARAPGELPPAPAEGQESGFLVPPSLRAMLGGRRVSEPVLRALLGLEAGTGEPLKVEELLDLLSPASSSAGARRIEQRVTARAEGLAPSEARQRVDHLAERIGQALTRLSRREKRSQRAEAEGRRPSPRISLDFVALAEGESSPLVQRLMQALESGRALPEGSLGMHGVEALLRSLPELSRELPGETVGPERRLAQKLKDQVRRKKDAVKERDRAVRERNDVIQRQVEHAQQEQEMRAQAQSQVGERTLKLARALFPKATRDHRPAERAPAFPASLPLHGPVDLMLVGPSAELIRDEAAPLLKEADGGDDVAHATTSGAAPPGGGATPDKLIKMMAPEQLDDFARRAFDKLINDIALDAERHGVDPYGWDP